MPSQLTLSPQLLCVLCVLCAFACPFAAAQEPETDSLDRNYADELPRIAPLEPAQALDSFEVHPGFRMELVAAEPLVRDPIAMAFDERGRLFVVEMRGYSEQRDENIGTIRLLEDDNGDGVYDRATTYVDNLAWPTAVACYDGGVFVGCAPDILYCKDTDDDGKADTRELVYTGFHSTNVQGLLNTFQWSLDNRIHGATSSSGADVRSPNDPALQVSLRGRDFSFDPRTRAFRAESGGAQHGLTFDDWGRKYLSHNSDHIQMTLYEDRYFARNPYYAPPASRRSIASDGPAADVFRISPVEPWRIVRTRLRVQGLVPGPIEGGGTAAGYFTSATGVTIYKGDAWPEAYRGNAFIGDVGSNLIHRKTLEPDGIAMLAHRADANTEFIRSRDIWFRPVQFCNGPDGNLYVADMYREVIEHPDSLPPIIKQHLDLTSGNDRGRIYRIVPENVDYEPPPDLGAMETDDLARQLDHPNAWHRETAARLLYERNDISVAPKLREIAARSNTPLGRTHACYALAGLDHLDEEALAFALRDPDPRAREHAVRLAEDRLASDELRKAVAFLATDPDPRVRYQVAFSLGETTHADKLAPLTEIARTDGADPLFRAAILSATASDAADLFLALTGDPANANAQLLADLARQTGAASPVPAIEAVLDRIDALRGAHPAIAQSALQRLARGVAIPPRGADVRDLLTARESTRAIYADLMQLAIETASNDNAKVDDRVEGVRALSLATYDEARPVLEPLLTQSAPQAVQLAALETFARFPEPAVGELLLERWSTFGPQLRSETIEVLFSRPEWLTALLDAAEQNQFNLAHVDSLRVEQLRTHSDDAIRERAATLLAARLQRADRQAALDAYQPVLTMNGDAQRGREIFAENCAQCHRVGNLGADVGPDLASVSQAGRDKLLVNILDPSREINPQYTQYLIETADWQTHTGIIANETATSVTLKRAHAETDTILRVNIESITSSNLSLMPEGWEEGIDQQSMADLLVFLTSIE